MRNIFIVLELMINEFKKELKENEYVDVERVNEMYEEALQLEREGKIK